MKKFMVTVLAALIGSLGYVVVDQSIEDRMAVLEEQVQELQEHNSSLLDKNSEYGENHSQAEEQHSVYEEKFSQAEEQHSVFEEKHSLIEENQTEMQTQLDSISSQLDRAYEEIEELNSRYNDIKSKHTKFIYPAEFKSRLKPNIYKTSYGEYYADFDITEHRIKGGKAVYLSPDGDDRNPGTKESPKRTFKAAFNETDCTTVYLLEGTYRYGEHYYTSDDIAGKNIIGIGKVKLNNVGKNSSSCLHSSGTAYLKNLEISGGTKCFYATLGLNEYLYIYKCSFHDCEGGNALSVTGGNSYLVECEVYNAYLDGFNYHKNSGENVIPCAVEINCKAYNIGNSENHSCNASTIHDGGSIIRIGGEYCGCHGGNVADTGTSEQVLSYSLNLGVYSHGSTQSDPEHPEFNSSFWARYTNMWLYECKSDSSTYDITALSYSSVYTTGMNTDKLFSGDTSYTDKSSTITEK
ncbi:MAG: hypothetical protein IKK49_04655 [Clostridia bacterium]|nr:hypothetical protein [Clostridia bacterium]